MRPPRLLSLVFCIIFLPIFFTLFSALSSSPHVATPSSLASQTTGLRALFSFNIPSSLFPPSAIISLTDDNSTFFLARPAAFGPLLSEKGLSGPLWVGSGFGERTYGGAEGELGCSDIPGWEEGDGLGRPDQTTVATPKTPASGIKEDLEASIGESRADSPVESDSQHSTTTGVLPPSTNDGTDDYLHHPLPDSDVVNAGQAEKPGEHRQNKPAAHADIQSLQESAEISGKVVLLSRGGCGFLEKVKWAQRRGAIAVVVGDDTRGGSLVTMYARGDTSNVTIPAVFTSYTTAHLLSSLIPPQVGADLSLEDSSGSSRAMLAGNPGKQHVSPTTTTSTTSSPTSTPQSTIDEPLQASPKPKAGVFHTLLSFLGLGSSNRASGQNQRPPSSGNIDWFHRQPQGSESDTDRATSNPASNDHEVPKSASGAPDGDGFMIGVQDWRDPDLLPPKSSPSSAASRAAGWSNTQSRDHGKSAEQASSLLKGGSITPGSGEYRSIEHSGQVKRDPVSSKITPQEGSDGNSSDGPGWFSKHFLRSRSDSGDSAQSFPSSSSGDLADTTRHKMNGQLAQTAEHQGLWVTLTPTSMSTSPFFDTLLVLVVSPLLTLTVVYALLLIRSRIRRRRWRAPKSIVARLPVRTYHTISTSSSAASSSRSPSPGPVSPTSPLLGSRRHSGYARSRSRSPLMRGTAAESKRTLKAESSKGEKSGPSSSLWRRKYTGRQVECVVCLEEYVDGQSKVMSLPCGHEFHAECITPWLTTRRRTCPICKGDVVRSMVQSADVESREVSQRAIDVEEGPSDDRLSPSSAPVPITSLSEDETSEFEHHRRSTEGRHREEHVSSAPQSSWRNMATLSFSALSGDTIWHQSRTDNAR